MCIDTSYVYICTKCGVLLLLPVVNKMCLSYLATMLITNVFTVKVILYHVWSLYMNKLNHMGWFDEGLWWVSDEGQGLQVIHLTLK